MSVAEFVDFLSWLGMASIVILAALILFFTVRSVRAGEEVEVPRKPLHGVCLTCHLDFYTDDVEVLVAVIDGHDAWHAGPGEPTSPAP